MASATPVVLIAGLFAGAPAPAAGAELGGKQAICVSGTQGKYARLAVVDKGGKLVKVFHLRKGCVTLRVGQDLPAGNYRVKHRAPQGRLTGAVSESGGREYPDGRATSGTSRDRTPPVLKKVKSRGFEMHPTAFGVIDFHSAKKPGR